MGVVMHFHRSALPASLLSLASLVALAALGTGCSGILGCEGNADTVDTRPVNVNDATASASPIPACPGSTFSGGDALLVTTGTADSGVSPQLSLSLAPNVAVGTSLPLTVSDAAAGTNRQTADAPDGTVHLVYTGNDDLETTAVAAALVTVDELPAAGDDLLEVKIELHYVDGRVLAQTFSATSSGTGVCPEE